MFNKYRLVLQEQVWDLVILHQAKNKIMLIKQVKEKTVSLLIIHLEKKYNNSNNK